MHARDNLQWVTLQVLSALTLKYSACSATFFVIQAHLFWSSGLCLSWIFPPSFSSAPHQMRRVFSGGDGFVTSPKIGNPTHTPLSRCRLTKCSSWCCFISQNGTDDKNRARGGCYSLATLASKIQRLIWDLSAPVTLHCHLSMSQRHCWSNSIQPLNFRHWKPKPMTTMGTFWGVHSTRKAVKSRNSAEFPLECSPLSLPAGLQSTDLHALNCSTENHSRNSSLGMAESHCCWLSGIRAGVLSSKLFYKVQKSCIKM